MDKRNDYICCILISRNSEFIIAGHLDKIIIFSVFLKWDEIFGQEGYSG